MTQKTKLDLSTVPDSDKPTQNMLMITKQWKGGYLIQEYDGEDLMACSTLDEVCAFLKGDAMTETNIAGLKCSMDGGGCQPLTKEEADAIWEQCQASEKRRAEQMPTENDALRVMFDAYQRLRELGWNDAIYCPKDGSMFQAIEAGSTGIHNCTYQGEWPKGSWWVHDDGDSGPSHPILFKRFPEQEAAYIAKMAAAMKKFAEELELL